MKLFDLFRSKTAAQGGPFSARDYQGRREKYGANYRQLAVALAEVLEFRDHLDVGCGQGLLIEPLMVEHDKDSYGVDGSPAVSEVLPQVLQGRVRTATIMDLKVERQYDLVSCVEVLEHIPEADSDPAVELLTRSARRFISLGGWKSEAMMRRYAAVTDQTLRAAAEAVSGDESLKSLAPPLWAK